MSRVADDGYGALWSGCAYPRQHGTEPVSASASCLEPFATLNADRAQLSDAEAETMEKTQEEVSSLGNEVRRCGARVLSTESDQDLHLKLLP